MGIALHERQSLTKLAKLKQRIEFAEELRQFKRLAESITQDLEVVSGALPDPNWRAAPVRGKVDFGYLSPESGAVGMRGEVQVPVPAVCQRCLNVLTWPLSTTLNLVFNVGGSTGEVTGRGDVAAEEWDVPDEVVDLGDIIDEALVMALPLAVKHEDSADCVPMEASGGDKELTRPFANLKAQMESEKKFDDEQ